MNLKTNIGDYFGEPQLKRGVCVGVEVEIESNDRFPLKEVTNLHWKTERDGSLRGEFNREYVLRRPMTKELAFKSIDELKESLVNKGTRINDSVRAGVHVHINVRDLSFLELWSMVTCWYVLENLLTGVMCGEGREGNHFCLRATDADSVVVRTLEAVGGRVNHLDDDDIRYAALNFCSLRKYGSLEFRAMRTPTDLGKIKLWIQALINLKENSKLHPNPRHVIENFSHGGEREFLRGILGHEVAEMLIEADPNYRDRMRQGIRIAQEIGYAKDDWNAVEEEVKEMEENLEFENINEFAANFGVEIRNEM